MLLNTRLVFKILLILLLSSVLLVACGQIDFDGPEPPELHLQATDYGLASVRFKTLPSVVELREINYQILEGQTSMQFLEYTDGDMQLIIFPPSSGCAVVKVDMINWSSQPFKSGFYVTPHQTTSENVRVCAK